MYKIYSPFNIYLFLFVWISESLILKQMRFLDFQN